MSSQLLDTPAKHPFSLTGFVDRAWQRFREGAFRTAFPPVAKLAEACVVSVLEKITEGRLLIKTPTASYSFPTVSSDDTPNLKSELRVLSDVFWIRLCTMGDLGFAEAYMFGEVECDDLVSTFLIFLRNRERLQNLDSKLSYLFTLPQKLTSTRFLNTLSNSRSNVSAHYDISNQMFAGFLSEDMTYSCAIFKDLDGDLNSPLFTNLSFHTQKTRNALPTPVPTPTNDPSADVPDELHEAQMRKLDYIIRSARIAPGQHVLEIGCGWGSLAVRVATQFPGTTVETLTLSVHQQALARARIAEAGSDVAARVTVHLLDYRAMPAKWAGTFDRVVSVEMVEAVGREYLEEYWRVIDWALKPDVGVGIVQGITIPEARFERYVHEVDFIQKWSKRVRTPSMPLSESHSTQVFPGGILPTLTLLVQTLTAGSQGRLVIDAVSNIGPHYARTLREWRRRFLAHFEDAIEPALKEEYPEVMTGANGRREIEVFRRKWIYYYCYCEVGFTTRSLGDHIITFTREGNESFDCSVFE